MAALAAVDGKHGSVCDIGDFALLHHINIELCILGSRQLASELVQTEAVMYALAENAAELRFSFHYEHIAYALFICGNSRAHSRGSAADYNNIIHFRLPCLSEKHI